MRYRLNDYAMSLLRLYAGGDAIVSWHNAFLDPRSGLFSVARTEDGATLLWIMAITGAVMIIDVLINDFTPDAVHIGKARIRLVWRRAFQYRHFLFVTLAFCYAAQPYVAAKSGFAVSLVIFYYWNSFQCLVLAFFDAKQRSRSLQWQRAAHS